MQKPYLKSITLGPDITLEDLVSVACRRARVGFSEDHREWVDYSWALVEQWVDQNHVMYDVTTGFGALCTKAISKEKTARLQHNIILSHSTSTGEPLKQEQARTIMLVALQNLGWGYNEVWLAVLEKYHEFLNHNLIPWIPWEDPVGYLCSKAHMAPALIGESKTHSDDRLLPGVEALEKAETEPVELYAEEGLALISGTTSATTLATLALYDLLGAVKTADAIAAITLEISKGPIRAFDDKVIRIRSHPQQNETVANIRDILADSEVINHCRNTRTQDAFSLRYVPQPHGATKKTLLNARKTLEIEINSCCDNPIIWSEPGEGDVISACNPDSSYIGIEMDSVYITATCSAEMSEHRNNRMADEMLPGNPWFLTKDPDLNSGLMTPQYTQAGLLSDIRMLSTPPTIDNTSTCDDQEDYVMMGYNAAEKPVQIVEELEYILATEPLSAYESQVFLDPSLARSPVTAKVSAEIGQYVPAIGQDVFLHPRIEFLRNFTHPGRLTEAAEQAIGGFPLRKNRLRKS